MGRALGLEFIGALIVLRVKEPHSVRPFRIPLNVTGLCLLFLLPLGVYTIALSGAIYASDQNGRSALFALGMLLSAGIVWRLIRWINPADAGIRDK